MREMIAPRDAYGEALEELGGHNDKVVVLEADVGGSTKSAVFGKMFPDRYFNVGIAELNMNSMAAGFAFCGLIPFTNTFAVFMTLRGSDPINSLIAYDKLPVKLAGTYCGLSDSYDGASHHAVADMAVMRALPGLVVLSPADGVETRKAVFAAAEYPGPVYLRLGRNPVPVITREEDPFTIGKGLVLREGTEVTIAATGYLSVKALEAAEELEKEGISARVLNIHTVKPLDEELILSSAAKTGAVVACEEHSVYGGLGSAVAEVLGQNLPAPLELVGLRDYAESGDYEALLQKYELDGAAIVRAVKRVLKRKREAF